MYPFSCYQIHSMYCKRHLTRNSSLHTPFPSIQFITIMQVVHNHIQNHSHWNDLHFVPPHPSHPFIQHPLHSHHISHPHSLIQKCGISLNMTSSFRDSLLPPLMIRRNAQQDRYDLMEVGLVLFEWNEEWQGKSWGRSNHTAGAAESRAHFPVEGSRFGVEDCTRRLWHSWNSSLSTLAMKWRARTVSSTRWFSLAYSSHCVGPFHERTHRNVFDNNEQDRGSHVLFFGLRHLRFSCFYGYCICILVESSPMMLFVEETQGKCHSLNTCMC